MALWTRRQEPARAVLAPTAPTTDQAVHSFRAWTESLQITGRIRSNDRLSDALNRRELCESKARSSRRSVRRPRLATRRSR
jgi:hypothetical protein